MTQKLPPKYHNLERFRKLAGQWMAARLPADFRTHRTKQLVSLTASPLEHELGLVPEVGEYKLPPELEPENDFLMSVFYLLSSLNTLAEIEVYFRRFPYRGELISKEAHCRNMCEFYFSTVYTIEERLETALKLYKKANPKTQLDGLKVVRLYRDIFKIPLRERHDIQHRRPFEDVGLDTIMVTGMFALVDVYKGNDKGWKAEERIAYRRYAAEWVERVRKTALQANQFTDQIIGFLLEEASFLKDLPEITPKKSPL